MIVGRYETPTGGCDTIKTQEEIRDRVLKFAKKGKVVVFEGITVATVYTRYLALDKEMKALGHKYRWIFLDTPLATCIERIVNRRKVKGNVAPFNPKHTSDKHRSLQSVYRHTVSDKLDSVMLNHKTAAVDVENIIRKYLKKV
jgi:predicted kinase